MSRSSQTFSGLASSPNIMIPTLEQRTYQELLAEIGGPGGVKNERESDAAKFARESVQPGGAMRNARLAAGLTPCEAATRAGIVSGLRWLDLETGEGNEATFREGMAVCKLLGIDVASLVEEAIAG